MESAFNLRFHGESSFVMVVKVCFKLSSSKLCALLMGSSRLRQSNLVVGVLGTAGRPVMM